MCSDLQAESFEQHSLVKYHNGIIGEKNKITHSHVT